jgi:O-antigen/teichoic acid export membrane protein
MPVKSTFRGSVIRNVQIVLVGLLVNQVVQTLGSAVMARTIHSPYVFGQASILLQILTMSGLLLNLGLNTAETYMLARHGKKSAVVIFPTGLLGSLAIGVVVALGIVLLAPMLSHLYKVHFSLALDLGSVSLIFNSATKVGISALSGLRQFWHQSIATITNSSLSALGLIIGVLVSPQKYMLVNLGISTSVFSFLAMIAVLALIAKLHHIRPRRSFRYRSVLKMLKFGIPMWAGNLAKSFQQPFLVIETGGQSMTAAGLLNNGLQIVGFLQIITWAFTVIALPMLSEVIHDPMKVRERGTLLYRYNNLLLYPVTAWVCLFPAQITHILFGSQYVNGAANAYVRLLAIGVLFSSMSRLGGSMLGGLGKPRGTFYVMLVSGGILVGLAPILIPVNTMLGPWVYVGGWSLSAMVVVWFLWRDGLSISWFRSFVEPLLPTTTMVFVTVGMVRLTSTQGMGETVAFCVGLVSVALATWWVEHRDRRTQTVPCKPHSPMDYL